MFYLLCNPLQGLLIYRLVMMEPLLEFLRLMIVCHLMACWYERLVRFNSDTCNVMKGKRNGVMRPFVKDNQI